MNPVHGQEGWELIEYYWDEDTGTGNFIYERIIEGVLEQKFTDTKQQKYWVHPALREIFVELS